jgi:predicted acylesterase/phospholipase RssA
LKRRVQDILYFLRPERRESLEREILARGLRAVDSDPIGPWYMWKEEEPNDEPVRFLLTWDLSRFEELCSTRYFNLLVLDTRGWGGSVREAIGGLLARLRSKGAPERSFPLNHVVAVLEDGPDLARRAFELGQLRIRSFVVEPFANGTLRDEMNRIFSTRGKVGKVALCLSGGGMEGLLFELGVLRALDAYLEHRSIIECDIICGISAGSIIAALLANKIEPRDIINGLQGREGGIEPIGPSLLYDFDTISLAGRLMQLYRALIGNPAPDQLMSRAIRAVPNGIFEGRKIEAMMERELTRPGRTNNFEHIFARGTELYIGATDLDSFEHRIFGTPGNRHVPISRAIRASCGLIPYYGPTTVDGRQYVDGQYTRTANFHLAVEQGATLVLVLDPLVPLRSEQVGYVASKGGIFSSIQGLKAVIHTRFTNAMAHAAEAFPDVSFHVFTPEDEDMKVLSGSPMKYNVRTQIIDLAYRCAVEKIQDEADLLRMHMARHGFQVRAVPRPR